MKSISWLIAVILATPCAAAPFPQCLENGATAVVSACMESELQRREARLKRHYRAALERLDPARRSELEATQRLWRRYRDRHCQLFYHPRSGSGGLLDLQQCLLDETARRIEALDRL